MGRPNGPGIAPANRRRGGDFSALVARIAEDEDALDGLLFAYESLEPGERSRLARAIIQDLENPLAAVRVLWAVEEDPSVKRELSAWIARQAGEEPWVVLRGKPETGEAWLIRLGLDGEAEALRIRWDNSEISSIEVESVDDPSFYLGDLVRPEEGAEVLTPLLWRYLRAGGVVPEGARRYAGFLVASPRR